MESFSAFKMPNLVYATQADLNKIWQNGFWVGFICGVAITSTAFLASGARKTA